MTRAIRPPEKEVHGMKTARALLAAAVVAALAGCATTEGDKAFTSDAWEKSKETTDAVAKSTTDTMKKTRGPVQGFFEHLWD